MAYWMISSARCRSDGGIVSPSAYYFGTYVIC